MARAAKKSSAAHKPASRRRAAPRAGTDAALKALKRYNEKRHFDITSEPRGDYEKRLNDSSLRFVIQQHDARRMHFDFRLELDGVLKSWAVPKGPSLSPADKRLAVEVEDHPIDYRGFEGNIPQGEYGGGAVIVWDRGTWKPEGDPHFGLKKGHLGFSLAGEKTNGRFSLVRLKERSGSKANGNAKPKINWLLMKHEDEFSRTGRAAAITERMPESVISGRTVTQVASGIAAKISLSAEASAASRTTASASKSVRKKSRQKSAPASARKMPALNEIDPQLATLVNAPPVGDGYLFEVKFDGYRALASIDGGEVQLRSRNRLDWTRTFPRIAAALAKLQVEQAIVDGEICFVTAEGRTRFQGLQNVMGTRGNRKIVDDSSLVFFLFDLLFIDGEDLRQQPLTARKQRLAKLLKNAKSTALRYSDYVGGDPRVALAQACKLGLEGLIAKRAGAGYEEGRSHQWLKLKCGQRQEFVIVGFAEAQGARRGFRSLLLGLRKGKNLRYVGKVGTGFTDRALSEISAQLKQRVVDEPPVENPPREKHLQWVKPDLVCEVSFAEMTRDGALRHPSFEGLRQDKTARQVTRENAVPIRSLSKRRSASKTQMDSADTLHGIRISHPDRVMDEQSGTSKGDLANYYATVAEWFLRYARSRPMALVRCPQGDAHQCFFQKNAMPGVGKSVHRGKAAGHGILWIEDAKGLIELVQFNAVEFHGWGAQRPLLAKPDWIVFDLDPDVELPFSRVIDAALEMRDVLNLLKLKSFVKTTGGKGLHVVVPIAPRRDWDEVKGFSRQIAETLARQYPERYVATMSKAKRGGKIFIDYLRNGEGSTAVLPYSCRSRPGANVAVPIAWKDLGKVEPSEFTVQTVGKWLGKRRADPWADFSATQQPLPKLKAPPKE